MKGLKELLKDLDILGSNNIIGELEVTGITHKSQEVIPNSIFFALDGYRENGINYVAEATKNGAILIVSERTLDKSIPHIVVKDSRIAMSYIAERFFDYPSHELKIISVVGTNGKTSVTHIINAIFNQNGIKTALIGTIGVFIDNIRYPTDMTTPDPIDLHKILRFSVDKGVKVAIIEASAHAIYLKKLENLVSEATVFTNFSQDHLDFFSSMEKYRAVKKSFFDKKYTKLVIANMDDDLGREISDDARLPVITYGLDNPSDIFAIDVEMLDHGMNFTLNMCDEIYQIETRLQGIFNVYNIIAAVGVCRMLNVPKSCILAAIDKLEPIEGRFNVYKAKAKVIIDYAHTPDGLENLLSSARKITKGKLIVVFGCGGNRDSQKRSKMGEIAARLADETIITKDNSRLEDPLVISSQIADGHKKINDRFLIILDREEAIKYAICLAKNGDTVVVAGKGAENYMDENGKKTPFSDKIIVENFLRG